MHASLDQTFLLDIIAKYQSNVHAHSSCESKKGLHLAGICYPITCSAPATDAMENCRQTVKLSPDGNTFSYRPSPPHPRPKYTQLLFVQTRCKFVWWRLDKVKHCPFSIFFFFIGPPSQPPDCCCGKKKEGKLTAWEQKEREKEKFASLTLLLLANDVKTGICIDNPLFSACCG